MSDSFHGRGAHHCGPQFQSCGFNMARLWPAGVVLAGRAAKVRQTGRKPFGFNGQVLAGSTA